jgi:hypothetical protein
MNRDRLKEIEAEIAELKARLPAHSVPPQMWQQLEELEAELEEAKQTMVKESHAGENGLGQLH